jgi:hypothetical protein
MVLFSIFYNIGFHGKEYTWASGFVAACVLALGGVGVGVGGFLALHTWLRWSAKAWLEAFLAVFLVVYGSYFVAEVRAQGGLAGFRHGGGDVRAGSPRYLSSFFLLLEANPRPFVAPRAEGCEDGTPPSRGPVVSCFACAHDFVTR